MESSFAQDAKVKRVSKFKSEPVWKEASYIFQILLCQHSEGTRAGNLLYKDLCITGSLSWKRLVIKPKSSYYHEHKDVWSAKVLFPILQFVLISMKLWF